VVYGEFLSVGTRKLCGASYVKTLDPGFRGVSDETETEIEIEIEIEIETELTVSSMQQQLFFSKS
jgi:hypothetical protein